MASIAFALTFWYDRNAFQYSPATLRYRTRYMGGQYMKFTMFAAGQNADPATKMSHHVSSNFCFASVSPFPLKHRQPTVKQRRVRWEEEEVTERNLLRGGLHGRSGANHLLQYPQGPAMSGMRVR